MLTLFSVAYWVYLSVTCVPFFAGALVVFAATALFDRRRVALHLYSCFWAASYLYANPLWRVSVRGREKLPWRGPAVLVANHSSLIDILVLFALYRPFKWVSKASVFKAPFIGWNMRLNGYVSLVRGEKESIARMMAQCSALLEAGCPVILFPEGTRSPDGEVKAFKDGAFRLAAQHRCPLIPIAIRGTGRALPKKGLVLREPMRAAVEVLDPLDPAQFGDDVAALREAARDRIRTALGQAARPVSATIA